MDTPQRNLIAFFAEAAAVAVAVFFAADFFVGDFPGFLAYWAVGLVAFVVIFAVAVVDFAVSFFYPFFQDSEDLYVLPHLQIQVPLPAALMT